MNTFTRTILASSLAFACAQASAAEFGAWHQVQKGVIERTNADGSSSRATYGPAGAQYTYDRLQARIAEIESGKVGVLDSLAELQSVYAALGVAASARLAAPDASAANDDWLAPMKVGPVINAADYTDTICSGHYAEFWSTYTNMFATASLVAKSTLLSGGFSPPPPAITQWTVTANASFLTTAGGTWNQVDTYDISPSGTQTTTASNGAPRTTGYCDGYSLGQVSVFCPGGGGDYASYERWYVGCP
ncbi:hypothetical protein DFR29_103173 [Tahibacter aquaticus]|uniref:Uncharacterized protein n=1 Tax=Tahibacter aquaticus TaxID=520092 RepID=A0A4R6Z4M7_9GAMM|nr:hypothetical protein [Tahibacter aquaticus]TDR46637.1 hypothetical protein DFR29_103173 [Tahibacter aquaticus]